MMDDNPCPRCHLGSISRSGDLFKDGPCASPECGWPKHLPTRPHYTDNPSKPIVDAGKKALELQVRYKEAAELIRRAWETGEVNFVVAPISTH